MTRGAVYTSGNLGRRAALSLLALTAAFMPALRHTRWPSVIGSLTVLETALTPHGTDLITPDRQYNGERGPHFARRLRWPMPSGDLCALVLGGTAVAHVLGGSTHSPDVPMRALAGQISAQVRCECRFCRQQAAHSPDHGEPQDGAQVPRLGAAVVRRHQSARAPPVGAPFRRHQVRPFFFRTGVGCTLLSARC